ncbi:endodeoxyribonuclease RusA [Clostridium homopropionicum DSM 5847]|uniref:Endodeoxyribonuclease RusA n=1 Tax=Clostridium homopropionicum DSM 5847 TaxID=1121318 RepID=A0A0L6Z5S5_9CLOT|nr:RusA family crossover junction endodeoxyribonuclease [Clostridium homopropionicum]KOA18312.1 endodeoxyribonuclease RusA [Clostridium homopropionicum DSM 5847]SFF69333.1 Endodeoxyribonuclease RusA [Clostridium homopropionicum]
MSKDYAKIVIQGSPITKSNFKLSNLKGRSILPFNSGKYHDRYAIYEQQIAYEARIQNPNTVLSESLIAILKVYYKSQKRHPDTTNIPKSIFDGIEKSGLIINDAQIRSLIIEEYYDSENPRFELELFAESKYSMDFQIKKRNTAEKPIEYNPPSNKKNSSLFDNTVGKKHTLSPTCEICGKSIKDEKDIIYGNKGKTLICKPCLKKLL